MSDVDAMAEKVLAGIANYEWAGRITDRWANDHRVHVEAYRTLWHSAAERKTDHLNMLCCYDYPTPGCSDMQAHTTTQALALDGLTRLAKLYAADSNVLEPGRGAAS